MTIEIDLELLKTTNLSPNEFIGLYLVFRKGYTYLEELNLNIDWTNLERKGYVKNELVTDKFKSLFSNNFDLLFLFSSVQVIGLVFITNLIDVELSIYFNIPFRKSPLVTIPFNLLFLFTTKAIFRGELLIKYLASSNVVES